MEKSGVPTVRCESHSINKSWARNGKVFGNLYWREGIAEDRRNETIHYFVWSQLRVGHRLSLVSEIAEVSSKCEAIAGLAVRRFTLNLIAFAQVLVVWEGKPYRIIRSRKTALLIEALPLGQSI